MLKAMLMAMLMTPLVARAEAPAPGGFSLVWEAPFECPSEAAVRERIEGLLPAATHPVNQPSLAVGAVVTAAGAGRWRLHLETRRGDETGERDLSSESCAALAESAAVIVTLLLNPPPSSAPSPTPPPPPAPSPPALSSPLYSSSTASPPPASQARPSLLLGIEGGATRGPLPASGALIGLVVGRSTRTWRLDLGARFRPEHRSADLLPGGSAAGGTFWLLAAGGRGCRMLSARRAQVGVCGGAELGAFHAASYGVRAVNQAWAPWIALGGGPLFTLALTERWRLRALVQGLVPLLRPRFEIDGVGLVHQPSPVSVEADVGAEVHF